MTNPERRPEPLESEEASRQADALRVLVEAGEAADYPAAERLVETGETRIVLCQEWLENEAGWGVRPDGCSLHLSPEDITAYVADYWSRMPDAMPDEFSHPIGGPFPARVDVATYARIKLSDRGVRDFGNTYAHVDPAELVGLGI